MRSLIGDRARELAHDKIHAIRPDATSHRWRLAQLLPSLIDEHGEVPIRSHILSLAHKQTRDCLREEQCALL